jgi:hypothetical protein
MFTKYFLLSHSIHLFIYKVQKSRFFFGKDKNLNLFCRKKKSQFIKFNEIFFLMIEVVFYRYNYFKRWNNSVKIIQLNLYFLLLFH